MTHTEEMERAVERLADAARELLDFVRDLGPDDDDEVLAWRDKRDEQEPILCRTLQRALREYECLCLVRLAGGAR